MTGLAWLLAAPAGFLTLAFALEVLVGLRRGKPAVLPDFEGSATIVVPAHDEAAGITATVRTLLRVAEGSVRILVVADNCRDDTASLAATAGADVIVRRDEGRRGKGFALAFARDHLASAPPQVVAVIDADCELDSRSLRALLARGQEGPVQAVYLLRSDPGAGAMVQASTFAFMIRNLVRQRGLARLSGRVHLTGTGMAFPWPLFATLPLATDNLVEDLGLGLHLSAQGRYPVLASDATVWSAASAPSATLQQRERWEGGFLATSLGQGVPMLATALGKLDLRGVWAALSLCIPPLALMILIDLAVGALAAVLYLFGASPLPALFVAGSVGAAGAAVTLAWLTAGRSFLTPAAAVRMPLYLLWKVPLYLKLLRGKPAQWLRTDRG